jgi:hypothetical protein
MSEGVKDLGLRSKQIDGVYDVHGYCFKRLNNRGTSSVIVDARRLPLCNPSLLSMTECHMRVQGVIKYASWMAHGAIDALKSVSVIFMMTDSKSIPINPSALGAMTS